MQDAGDSMLQELVKVIDWNVIQFGDEMWDPLKDKSADPKQLMMMKLKQGLTSKFLS